jgi:Uma2 family endonuclease
MQTTIHEINELIDRVLRDGHVVLHAASWEFYEAVLDEIGDSHIFVNYDRGEMEVMAPSQQHDRDKSFIARLLEAMALELDIDIECFGSTTWKRKSVKRGIEPDECFYIGNAAKIRHKEIDLEHDPAPDLALEIDVRSSALDRESIYAALKIPELWRYDGRTLTFLQLQHDRTYAPCSRSLSFPMLTSGDLERFLNQRASLSSNQVLKQFLIWVREQHSNS